MMPLDFLGAKGLSPSGLQKYGLVLICLITTITQTQR